MPVKFLGNVICAITIYTEDHSNTITVETIFNNYQSLRRKLKTKET